MHEIEIRNLGPIKKCDLRINQFMVFTGLQSSGKSTICKSIFFFRKIKDILYGILSKRYYLTDYSGFPVGSSLKNILIKEIRSNFLQTYGSTWCMDNTMSMRYNFNKKTWIKISLKPDPVSPNYIWIDLSENFGEFLVGIDSDSRIEKVQYSIEESMKLRAEINRFFEDEYEIVYIPAGRSISTLLGAQINYFYSTMDDMQKRTLDLCTSDYLERIIKLKTFFSNTTEEWIYAGYRMMDKNKSQFLTKVSRLMTKILQGEYRYVNGEERLQISDDRYIKINFASSGQQEALWILNILFYYLLEGRKACFIIEEPESHLFPNAQKLIMEFIAMSQINDNQIFLTTHSPYILGTLNNLLYASKISDNVDKKQLNDIIEKEKWIEFEKLSAYFVGYGECNSCMDFDYQEIKNDVIDGASKDINDDFDKMVELETIS